MCLLTHEEIALFYKDFDNLKSNKNVLIFDKIVHFLIVYKSR